MLAVFSQLASADTHADDGNVVRAYRCKRTHGRAQTDECIYRVHGVMCHTLVRISLFHPLAKIARHSLAHSRNVLCKHHYDKPSQIHIYMFKTTLGEMM